jgi:septal ring factor EnvC (AmiA/AmiB activator)
MNTIVRVVSGIGVTLLFLAACGDGNAAKRQILMSQLQQSDGTLSMLTQTIAGRRSNVAQLEQRLSGQRSELAQFRGRVKAFMLNHKMAIAAITAGVGGAGVALNPRNEFSKDAEAIGGMVAVVAAIYALANAEEIAQVADALFQADAHFKTLQGHIDSTNLQLREELFALQEEEKQHTELNQQSADLRLQLAALQ